MALFYASRLLSPNFWVMYRVSFVWQQVSRWYRLGVAMAVLLRGLSPYTERQAPTGRRHRVTHVIVPSFPPDIACWPLTRQHGSTGISTYPLLMGVGEAGCCRIPQKATARPPVMRTYFRHKDTWQTTQSSTKIQRSTSYLHCTTAPRCRCP